MTPTTAGADSSSARGGLYRVPGWWSAAPRTTTSCQRSHSLTGGTRHCLWLALLACSVAQARIASYGELLYAGRAPLRGVISGQHTPMPAAVLACTNCHVGGQGETAPDLRDGWLTQIRSRRNGPAGRYTQASFCRALRTGIDPVYVMLTVRMPRFAISDPDCASLWAYLTAGK